MNVTNHGRFVFVRRPSLNSKSQSWYNPADAASAWALFINASVQYKDHLINSTTFRYDLVDLTRQNLQLAFDSVYTKLVAAFNDKNIEQFTSISHEILQVLDDIETLLASDEHFLVGRWIEAARALGDSSYEKRYNEYQARNQITIWGPNGNVRYKIFY